MQSRPAVNDRHRTSPLYPVQVPDLIGVNTGATSIGRGFSNTARSGT